MNSKLPQSNFLSYLMTGIKYMIPISISSGFLIGIASVVAFQHSPSSPETIIWQFPDNDWGVFFEKLYEVGKLGFQVMIPVFSAGVAYGIAGTLAIGPALLGGFIINSPQILDTASGAGFVGGIIIGFLTGYLVLGFRRIKWPRLIQDTVAMIVIPFVTTLIIFIVSYYILGQPLAYAIAALYDFINQITIDYASAPIIYGAILGGMIGFDLGGPVNKTASLVAAAIFIDTMTTEGPLGVNGIPQAATAAAIAVAPIGVALAVYLFSQYFSQEAQISSLSTLVMGFMGVSEGAIPIVVAQPILVITNTVSSALAGAIVASQHIHFYGGIGSPLGVIVGYMTRRVDAGDALGWKLAPQFIWLLAIFGSALLNALLFGLIMKIRSHKEKPS